EYRAPWLCDELGRLVGHKPERSLPAVRRRRNAASRDCLPGECWPAELAYSNDLRHAQGERRPVLEVGAINRVQPVHDGALHRWWGKGHWLPAKLGGRRHELRARLQSRLVLRLNRVVLGGRSTPRGRRRFHQRGSTNAKRLEFVPADSELIWRAI